MLAPVSISPPLDNAAFLVKKLRNGAIIRGKNKAQRIMQGSHSRQRRKYRIEGGGIEEEEETVIPFSRFSHDSLLSGDASRFVNCIVPIINSVPNSILLKKKDTHKIALFIGQLHSPGFLDTASTGCCCIH